MTTISSLISQRLAALGVTRPSPSLLAAVEAELAPRVSALVARSVTKPLVARAFASTLVDAPQGSPEGGVAPALASSPEASCDEQDKPPGVAGATADAPATPEAL